MKKFNPERELYKIKYGKRDKIILLAFLVLIVGIIGYSFALYQVKHSKRIVYTTVDDFSKDIQLAVFVDGVKKEDFPKKEEGKIYTKISCNDDNATASWDYNDWRLILESKLPNKCNVYFETRWKDGSGASYPELYQGLIPITIGSNGELTVADVTKEWYDYNKHNWANAILIDDSKNHNIYYNEDGTYKKDTTIPIDDVLQMYVWIPRYRYKLWNVLNGNSNPFAIEIEFESNTTGRSISANNGEWLTHPAFLFGDTELNGFWVGKFEPSDPTDANGRTKTTLDEITILPNKTSVVMKTIKTMFDAEQKLKDKGNKYNLNSNEVDTRMMKNSEYGAVVYLTSSKYGIYTSDGANCMIAGMTKDNCKVWRNNTAQGIGNSGNWQYGGTYTGCAEESVDAATKWNDEEGKPAKCDSNNVWNQGGVKASTTGNMYGIYDMSGGAWEYMMGVIKTQDGKDISYGLSDFNKENMPDPKYYDLYDFSDNTLTHEKGHLGDATRETMKEFGKNPGTWNASISNFPIASKNALTPWFLRGGHYSLTGSGLFVFLGAIGNIQVDKTFRSVLSAA